MTKAVMGTIVCVILSCAGLELVPALIGKIGIAYAQQEGFGRDRCPVEERRDAERDLATLQRASQIAAGPLDAAAGRALVGTGVYGIYKRFSMLLTIDVANITTRAGLEANYKAWTNNRQLDVIRESIVFIRVLAQKQIGLNPQDKDGVEEFTKISFVRSLTGRLDLKRR